jgi:hypothetical protein
MTKVKTLEFWLFALPVLLVLAGWAAGFDHDENAKYLIIAFAGVWLMLAIYWMLRELVRRLFN